jgi:hypothetical protein
MAFIELHYNGNPRLIIINHISAMGSDDDCPHTFIWLNGDSDCLYVDESYDEIKNKLQEAGYIWNV